MTPDSGLAFTRILIILKADARWNRLPSSSVISLPRRYI
jgi:hypothetical protein